MHREGVGVATGRRFMKGFTAGGCCKRRVLEKFGAAAKRCRCCIVKVLQKENIAGEKVAPGRFCTN